MKIIMFKYFFQIKNLVTLVICGMMLTACDFSASSADNSKKVDDWQCTKILSQNKVLCSKGKQSITVTFENLIIPGTLDSFVKNFIFDQTFCSTESYEKFSKEALECVTELLLNQSVKIVPEPGLEETKLTAKIFTSRGTDVAITLIKEGLALVKKNSSKGNYSEYQKQAINLERGLWKSNKILNDIFNVETSVDITVTDNKNDKIKSVKGLRRFHSPDLIRAPMLVDADTSKEEKSMVEINCKANVNIKINLPPKEYELTIFFRPRAKANVYSGPLESFKETEMEWKEKFIDAKGGESIDAELKYEILNLSLVTRGGTKVYSGYIVEGYEIEIRSDEKIIFKKNGNFAESEILEKLESSEKGVF